MWTAADCSQMTCPRGVSWVEQLGGDDGAEYKHKANRECSDKGICDRTTGECSCFPGYEGSACQRTTCPNDCSGHGTCRSNTDFTIDFSEAVFSEQDGVASLDTTSYYDYFLVTYDKAWDSGLQYGCLCDMGFRGVDCAQMECPTSYDPMDEETCAKYSEWEESGTFSGGNSKSTEQGNVILISEWDEPGNDAVAVAYYNPIEEYPCNGAPAGAYCSGRGQCDTGSGICQCYAGFTGPACEEVAEIF
jgi:hypothetical protein